MKKAIVLTLMVLLLASSIASAANWVDGVYEAWSDAGARSIGYAKVFIEDGKIAAVILREYTDILVEKDFAVYAWPEAREASQTLAQKFVKAQGADVDIVTKATGSSTMFKQAVERALLKADPNAKLGKYFEGVFLGRSHWDPHGYYELVRVTIKDDKIVDIVFQRVKTDYTMLDPADYAWPLDIAWEQYTEAAKISIPGYVDVITGATGLTLTGNIAVRDALTRASTE
ncbi:MAG TPA: FMN-binding protein [Limnochordia bacterium]|nr:FMN-binding protein [Limnochordia bacterium]